MLTYLLLTCLVVVTVRCEEGYASGDYFAYHWYVGEPFHLYCNNSELAVTSNNYVIWETPTKKLLQGVNDNDNHFQVMDYKGVSNFELKVVKVEPVVHGVYICRVYSKSTREFQKHAIFGLNIMGEKYHDNTDKYRHNIIVAFIATAVFVVSLGTICVVFHFRYKTPEYKAKKIHAKNGKQNMYIADNETGMKQKPDAREEVAAYENPSFSTQL